MKHKYLFLFILTFIGVHSFAQTCPSFASVIPAPTEIVLFTFDSPGPDCGTRPATITIDGSTYSLGNCDTFSSNYTLTSGSGVVDPDNFTVIYGSSSCDYNTSILPTEKFSLSNDSIRLYPNPVNSGSYLYVDFGAFLIDADIKVYSVTGKQVQNYPMKNSNRASVNISGLSNGVYLIKITTNSESLTRKFVIMK